MINLKTMTKRYFDLFGKSPKFEQAEPMSDDKTTACIGYCIDNNITAEDLSSASRSKNQCSVWDFIMNEDLDKPGACKYGELEKK